MDVGSWLLSLGLGQYEANFRDNKIDADLLPRLTDAGLKDIGVSALGDRLRLLDAIAELASAKPLVNSTVSSPKGAALESREQSAERRPITVMFCDLVGSTNLAAKLDPEDWRNLVNAYLDQASAAVTDFGGHVLKKLGDGLMALFGYPHAQENDAERAVRAALAIQRAISDLNNRNAANGAPELSARIGIESGPVVVEASGEVFGDAPNIAARVQAEAEPGSVLITLNVQRQVAGLFVAEEQSTRELKGVSQPVQLFRIVRASGGGRRGGMRALTPFVGREEELSLLARRWERALAGEGQLVLIVGEPGLGKSRLIEEFHARLAETPHTWVEWSASQLLQNTPLHPVAEWGRQRFGLDAPAEQRLADLEGTLRLIGLDPVEYAPLVAPLVDIPLPPVRAASFPAEELRRRQLAAMTAWVLAGARSQPVVLAFEDLHWADPTSLDLLRALAERGAQAPLFLLATTRPEFRAPWSLRSHHSVISLSPLDRAGVARMVGEISASHALSKEVIEGVSERTGGVPLFVEEVTRLLVERGEQGGVQAIPPTLQQSLAARLDRLGPARELAQVGAVLGRDFTYLLLRDVAEADEPAVQASLDRLADADLLFVEGAPPQANYRFKHALIQDAAYDSLLKSRRQALHRRAAEMLRDSATAQEPEAIAHHFTQAGLDDLAIEWWGKAGDQALRRSAFKEAIAHLGKAIEMSEAGAGATQPRRPGGPAAPTQHLTQLHVGYGNALIAARGYGARETTEAFAKARESASGDKDAPERLAADFGLWAGSYARGELPSMRAQAAAFLSDVAARPDSPEAGVAHRAAGMTCWFAGEYHEARDHLGRALALFQPGRDDDLAFRFGPDPGVAAMAYLAFASWPLGEVDRSVSLIARMQTRMAGVAHVTTLALGRMHAALFELMRGDHARAARNAFELGRLAREQELAMFRAFAVFLEGWPTAASGAIGNGLEDMRRGAELLREQNVLAFDGLVKIALAEAEARAGDPARAIAILDEALTTCDRTGNRAFEAELQRARGEILLKQNPANSAPAEESFLAAIAVARQQGTRSFELRASLSLAKLYQSTIRPAEAHAILAPALEGFAPTSEMPEIAEAQALLATLADMDEVKSAEGQRQRRLHLQMAYGQAVMWSKGFATEEAKAAFERAAELAASTKDFSERFAALHGQWALVVMRGELRLAGELASQLLAHAKDMNGSVEVAVARRGLGFGCYFAGDFDKAQDHFKMVIDATNPEGEEEVRERFGEYSGTFANSHLGLTKWQLGEVDRARELIDLANCSAAELGHVPSITTAIYAKSHLAILRGDAAAAMNAAEALRVLGREHGMALQSIHAEMNLAWARGRLYGAAAGAEELKHWLGSYGKLGVNVHAPFFHGLLAELEFEALGAESALARIEEGLAIAQQTGIRCDLAFLHRLRGDILLKRGPPERAAAEEAFRTALDIAKEQGARSWGLRAALALAKLCQSTGRLVDAQAVLAPALEGFLPTPEMLEIAEAQALLAALEETEEVKAGVVQRERRLRLQTAYGQAVMWSKGFAAKETKVAFLRAAELATTSSDFSERFTALQSRWAGAITWGELRSARELASTLLREAEDAERIIEAGVANSRLGLVAYFQGDFVEARTLCERAIDACNLNPDSKVGELFGYELPSALSYLAATMWQLGEVKRARDLITSAGRHASEVDIPTIVDALFWKSYLEIWRGDPLATLSAAEALEPVAREHGMTQYVNEAELHSGWARGRINDPMAGAAQVRRVLAAFVDQGVRVNLGLYTGLLAELEAETLGADRALARIDEAFALSDQVEHRCSLPLLHRLRGQILLRRDPRDTAPAEEALMASIAIAKEQGARSPVLLAALSLAKHYQSTDRLAEAQAVLAPALEGFAQTPEMPEIAEAQTLLVAIEAGAQVRHD